MEKPPIPLFKLLLLLVLLPGMASVVILQAQRVQKQRNRPLPPPQQAAAKKGASETMTVAKAVETIRPSVVQIVLQVYDPDPPGTPPRQPGMAPMRRPLGVAPIGTGFLVSDQGYVITARHVVDAMSQVNPPLITRLMVGLAGPNLDESNIKIVGSFDMYEAEIIEKSNLHDLALLKLFNNPFKRPGTFATINGKDIIYNYAVAALVSERPTEGAQIVVSGYPFASNVLVTNAGWLASSWAINLNQSPLPNANQTTTTSQEDLYLADIRVNPGNSGGPVFSIENNGMIGVCVAQRLTPVLYGDAAGGQAIINNRPLAYNSGIAHIVPIKYVIEMMKRHNVAETLASSK